MPETTQPSPRRHRAPVRWRRLAVQFACTLLSVPGPAFAGQRGTGGGDGSDANPVGRIVEFAGPTEGANMWFTELVGNRVGRVTVGGHGHGHGHGHGKP